MQSGNLDIACAINVHQQQNGYPNNKETYNTHVTVCVFTHILDAIYIYFSDSNWAVSCRANVTTKLYSVSWLTCPRFVAEPRRVGTDPDFIFRRSARPALYWPKLRKESSVKCLAQTYKTLGRCVGALPEKIKWTHSFFIGSDEGTTKILRCSFVHPNTEQLPCFARLQAMMSLEEKKCCGRLARTVVAHFLMGGPNSLGGQSRERGGNLSPYDDIRGRFQIGPF